MSDLRRALTGTITIVLLVIVTAYFVVATPDLSIPNSGIVEPGIFWDNVVIIAMENKYYTDIFGSNQAPYLNGLLPSSSTIPNFHAGFYPNSEADYVALWSGDTYNASDGVRNINAPTIIDLLEARNFTWRAYWETGKGQRLDHWPPGLFTTISRNPARVARLVNASAYAPEMIQELNSPNASNFIWFTPTDDHNMHDNSIKTGDTYLQTVVSQILASTTFKTKRSMLIIWWDEYNPAPNLFTGSVVKQGFVSNSTFYDHYSVLKLFEAGWSLGNLGRHDVTAQAMAEILR